MTGKKTKKSKPQEVFTKLNPLCAGNLRLFVGAKIEALDSRRWYQARVVKIDASKCRVLVHFEGWNSRHDKWFEHGSDFLRPLNSNESGQNEISLRKELQPGDRILARWSDSKFYPAKIHSLINEKTYEVIFFDGFKKRLNKSSIRPVAKRTFQSFEEKFKAPSPEGTPAAASTPLKKGQSDEPVASSSGSRTKRRHTEPSAMADFVTSIPGKRAKVHHLGFQSDSDELSSSHDSLCHKSNEEDVDNQGSSSGAKRGSALCKEKRLGYPVVIDIALSHAGMKKAARPVSPQKGSVVDQLSSSADSLSSDKGQDSLRDVPGNFPISLPKTDMRKTSSILKVKLPMKPRHKRRGRKKFFRLKNEKLKPNYVSTPVDEEKSKKSISQDNEGKMSGNESELLVETDENDKSMSSSVQGEILRVDSRETLQTTKETGGAEKAELNLGGRGVLKNGNDPQARTAENSLECSNNTAVTSSSSVSSPNLRIQKKRGRKPGKLKASRNSTGEQKILPKRERRLTEKGLELLQIIGHKKGVECLLKEAFGSVEVNEADDSKDSTSCSKKCTDPSSRETDYTEVAYAPDVQRADATESEVGEEKKTFKVISETEGSVPSSKNERILSQLGKQPKGHVIGVHGKASLGMEEPDNSVRHEDRYSDTFSEASGDLVIDLEDDVKGVASDSNQNCEEVSAETKSKDNNFAQLKPRGHPRMKYTLSREERKGNRLAKLKQNRVKSKLKREKPKQPRSSMKVDKDRYNKVQESHLGETGQPPQDISPLESLTRMVTETPPSMVSSSQDKLNSAREPTKEPVSSEEATKLCKTSKQQRGPYKSRMKISENFLSMVEQKRPSQIERPLSDDLIKTKTSRGRSRNRILNRTDDGKPQENGSEKKDDANRPDLNEPLEFSHSLKNDVKTIDLNKMDVSGLVFPQKNIPGYSGEQSGFVPSRMGYFARAQNSFIGQLPRCVSPQQMETFRKSSPNFSAIMSTADCPVYSQIPLSAPQIMPYKGMVGIPDVRATVPSYAVNMQPIINASLGSNPPSQMPMEYPTRCLRMQGPRDTATQGSIDMPGNIGECSCKECRSLIARPVEVVREKINKLDGSAYSKEKGLSCEGKITSFKKSEHLSMNEKIFKEEREFSDRELIITDVFSLRQPTTKSFDFSTSSEKQSVGDDVVKLEGTVGSEKGGTNNVKGGDAYETTIEGQQVTVKPKAFETKKKRLDIITGKLSAQKRMSPVTFEAGMKIETSDSENGSPFSESTLARAAPEVPASPVLSHKKQTGHPDSQLQTASKMEYMYPQKPFIPVMDHPHFDPLLGFPPSSMDGPPPRMIAPDVQMVPHHQLHLDPRLCYPNPEYFQPIRPHYDAEGVPPPMYQANVHGLSYMSPEMMKHARFHQAPTYPYATPRFGPSPRYFIQRESFPMATSRPPPPYGSFPMTSSAQRFRAIAPNGRIPLVVCKQANCNCHLPHAAPPIQMHPAHLRAAKSPSSSSSGVKVSEDDAVKSKVEAGPKMKEPMMKGDPRRLTLPLQRMRKVDTKQQEDEVNSFLKQAPVESASGEHTGVAITSGNEKDAALLDPVEEDEIERSAMCSFDDVSSTDASVGKSHSMAKKSEKGQKKEHVLAPREFVVELELNEFQCKFKGCKKSFRKAASRDNHQRYFHSPRLPQRKIKTSSCIPSPVTSDTLTSPATASHGQSKDHKALNEDATSIRSAYLSSVLTDDNISDHDKQEESSSDEFEDSDMDSNGSVCVDDVIKCNCDQLEEQGFMIQCEQCFTWQHGDCVNLTMQTVPKNYLCYICTNPDGLRRSYEYKNNYEWYKRGSLPSILPLENENEEKMNELMQASHALMEDIANIFDVIAGMKRKIKLLSEPCHPFLKFWRSMDEGKASQGSNDKMEREKDESREDRTQDKAMDEDLEMDESTTLEGSQAISAKKPLDDLVFLHEEKNEKENGQTKSSLMDDSTVKTEDKSEKNDPNGIPNVKNVGDENKRSQEHIDSEDCESEIVPMKRTEIDQEDAKEDAEENGSVTCGTTEMDAFEIVHTKLCLQDHLDSIEVELNQRMDEIESNLDVLERRYNSCEMKAEECENKSAFKVALPDMTSIARHLNMINRQLIDLS